MFDEDSYLSDQDYKTLYDDRGSILSLLYNEIVGDEFINVDSYSELGDGIKQYCRNREKNSRQRRLKKPSASGRYKKGHPQRDARLAEERIKPENRQVKSR